jgi:hypothetical protein
MLIITSKCFIVELKTSKNTTPLFSLSSTVVLVKWQKKKNLQMLKKLADAKKTIIFLKAS